MRQTVIRLDGSHGEGGGALVRSALALSAITEQPCEIKQIRYGLKSPGLREEDIAVASLLAESCAADVDGLSIGSHELRFSPTRRVQPIHRALAAPQETINAQVVIGSVAPILARTGGYSTITVMGETYGHRRLSFDYFSQVTVAAWRRMGLYLEPDLLAAGYGRGSQGEVVCEIEPSAYHALVWRDRGDLRNVRAIISLSELPEQIAERGAAHLSRLAYYSELEVDVTVNLTPSRGPGAFATVWLEYESGLGGATAMGARGVRIESVVQAAFDAAVQWRGSSSTVDPFLADQILLPAAFAEGETVFRTSEVTERLTTIAWVIKQFLPIHVTIKGKVGEPGIVTVRR